MHIYTIGRVDHDPVPCISLAVARGTIENTFKGSTVTFERYNDRTTWVSVDGKHFGAIHCVHVLDRADHL